MSTKATHDGTCQVCGRLQALPGSRLSKHGYDVEFHFFRGVCPGAHHAPLETDRALADTVSADLAQQAVTLRALAVEIDAGRAFPQTARSGEMVVGNRGRKEAVMVPYAEAPEQWQRDAVAKYHARTVSHAKQAEIASKEIAARADAVHGKRELQARADAPTRKEIVAGTRVQLHGKTVTVTRVDYRVAQGCGPFLNGNSMPHLFYESNGKEYAYPIRLIRQKSILEGEPV